MEQAASPKFNQPTTFPLFGRKSITAGARLFFACGKTLGAGAPESDINVAELKTTGQRNGKPVFRRDRNIHHGATNLAQKMAMFPHVGTEAGGAFLQGHLADEAALDQGAEGIVNRGKGNFGHSLLRTAEYFLGGGVVMAFSDHFENLLPLPGQTKSARREPALKT